jgi:NAD+ synthase (glutamine-hydrolysing)
MKHGFVKVAAATPSVKVGDCGHNAGQIINMIKEAEKNGASIIVFPELSITGYTCEDLFWQESLIKKAKENLVKIARQTTDREIVAIVGLPFEFEGKLYNVAAVIYDGEILGIVPKSFIPNYSEFYEARHFASGVGISGEVDIVVDEDEFDYSDGFNYQLYLNDEEDDDDDDDDFDDDDDDDDDDFEDDFEFIPFGTDILFKCTDIPNLSFAVEICEDLWVPNPPSSRHAMNGATLLINLSASDEITGKAAYRESLVKNQSARCVAAYVYADCGEGESSTDLVFSGHNIIAENGKIIGRAERFSTGITYGEIDLDRISADRRRLTTFVPEKNDEYEIVDVYVDNTDDDITRKINNAPFVPADKGDRDDRCNEILTIQAMGLKKRLDHTGCKCAVIGISGGLDSTLALLVTVKSFDMLGIDRKNIVAVTMPGFGTTDRTYTNALKLIEELGCTLKEVNISEAVELHFKQIGHDINVKDVTYENAQARQRTYLLMDFANEMNGMVIGTGDLSELALGWATYNGDHMSMYGVNGGVPKTLVRHLVRYFGDTCESETLKNVLYDVLDTPVSPELLPPSDNGKISQKTEDLVGPYELHDFFLYYILRFGFRPKKVLYLAERAFEGEYDKETILKWLKVFYRRFFAQQFKRSCLPDGPKVGSVAVSPRGDLRMPSDACVREWLSDLEN